MFASLRWKLSMTYLLVVAMAMGLAWVLIGRSVEGHFLKEREVALLVQANIASDIARTGDSAYRTAVRDYARQTGARILILDRAGRVTVDSFLAGNFEGQTLPHAEVAAALRGETGSGAHFLPGDGWAMYVGVPVTREQEVQGAVLLSSDINDTMDRIAGIKRQLAAVLATIAAAVALFSLAVAGALSRPLQQLTAAVDRMAGGALEQRVNIGGSDELGRLGRAFNDMARKVAALDRTRRAFVADASHELRTPLGSIKALAESVLRDQNAGAGVYRECLADINSEIDRLARLVNDLLELAKLDENPGSLALAPCNVSDLVERILNRLRPLAAAREVNLAWEPAAGDMQAMLDEERAGRAIYNVLDNAVKFTPPGGRVTASVYAGGRFAVVEISDTGPGIPAEVLPNVFDRFVRADRSRARTAGSPGGFGLGLAIAREIVDLHGGEIAVTSREGEGCRFVLKFALVNQNVSRP